MMPSPNYLVLEKGSIFKGLPFGKAAPLAENLDTGVLHFSCSGELVFNTAHSGYHEVLTDPSYTGQIVAMTYPHIGNYGATDDWSECGPEGARQVREVKAAGFVVRSLYKGPVPEGRLGLHEYLLKHGIPGISNIDTRALTLELRDKGSQKAVIVSADQKDGSLSKEALQKIMKHLESYPTMEGCNLVKEVGSDRAEFIQGNKGPKVVLLDCGAKANIIRELKLRDCSIHILPSTATSNEILACNADGVLVSNGPGDPAALLDQIACIKGLIGKVPLTGICLGHQLISLALNAKTFKMKFGHHGVNHPVRDEFTKKVFVTSQNHGFAVDESSLPKNIDVWFRNANDLSIEGIFSTDLKIATAQFHPESAPGPYDSLWIFDKFLSLMK